MAQVPVQDITTLRINIMKELANINKVLVMENDCFKDSLYFGGLGDLSTNENELFRKLLSEEPDPGNILGATSSDVHALSTNVKVHNNSSLSLKSVYCTLCVLHTALQDSNIQQLKNKVDVNVYYNNDPFMNMANKIDNTLYHTVSYNGNSISIAGSLNSSISVDVDGLFKNNVLSSILNNNSFGCLYVVRRIVYMYIFLIRTHLAIGNYTANTRNADSLSFIQDNIINKIANINYNSRDATGTLSQLNASSSTFNQMYLTNTSNINNTNSNLDISKKTSAIAKDVYSSREKTQGKTNILILVTTIVLLSLAVGIIVTYIAPFEKHMKLKSLVTMVAVACLFGFGMHIANTKFISEHFYSVSTVTLDTGIRENDILKIVLKYIGDYVTDTVSIDNTLKTFRMFQNASASIHKEGLFYNSINDTIVNQTAKTKGATNLVTHTYEEQINRMYLFITYSIVLTTAAFFYVFFDENESVQSIVMYIAIAILVIAFIFYILEVNVRVRTDGKKFYWMKETVSSG